MADADEPIELTDYDPRWPDLYREEATLVRAALGTDALRSEHMGSTAVPGLSGKPVIDILVGTASLEIAKKSASKLAALEYEDFGELFIPGRIYLRRRGKSRQQFDVALAAVDSEFYATQLAVRDFLRAHPGEAAAYAEEKKKAYAAGARLFSTYSQAKGAFVASLIERARAWKK
jgi:GrpB-like predicted nucleotidyltransferase (UPF0157 family)